GQLNHHPADQPIPGLADSLFVSRVSAVIGRGCQTSQASQLAAVAGLAPAEDLSGPQPCTLCSDSRESRQLTPFLSLLTGVFSNLTLALCLQFADVAVDQLPSLEFA